MSKAVSGTTTQFTWNPAGGLPALLQDKAGAANPTSYIYGPGGLPVEQIDPSGAAHFYHHDQLGSTRAISSATGVSEDTYTYDPYGNVTASTGTVTNPFQFSGEYKDAESGLTYLRARYYDPATTQFISRDPLVALTRSPYGYVAGNPLNATDPSGLDPWGNDQIGGWVELSHLPGSPTISYNGAIIGSRGRSVPYTVTVALNGSAVQSEERQTNAYGASEFAGAVSCAPGSWTVIAQGRDIYVAGHLTVSTCEEPSPRARPVPHDTSLPWWIVVPLVPIALARRLFFNPKGLENPAMTLPCVMSDMG